MSRRFQCLVLFGLVLFAVQSCTNKDNYLQPSIEEVTGNYPSVFSIDDFSFDPQGSSGVFSYVSDGSWRVSQAPGWLVVSPRDGKEGRTLVTISTSLNTDWNDRTGTLVFTGGDGQTHQITVKQECPKLGLSVKPLASGMVEVFERNAEKDSPSGAFKLPFLWSHASGRTEPVELTVSSNVNWEMTLSDTTSFFISTDKKTWSSSLRGVGDSVVYLNTVNNNYSQEDNAGILSLKAYTDDSFERELDSEAIANWTLNLSQSHLLFLLGLSSNENEMSADNLEVRFDELGYVEDSDENQKVISVKCELPWSVSLGSFTQLDNVSNGEANAFVTRRLDLKHPATQSRINPNLNEMVDTLFFKAIDQSGSVAVRKLVVHQKEFAFSVDTDNLEFENGVFLADGTRNYLLNGASPKVYTISLNTSGAWRLEPLSSEASEWLEVDSATLKGTETRDPEKMERQIRLWVKKQNLKLEDIKEQLHFRPDYGWADNQTQLHSRVTVLQKAFSFEADLLDKDELSATQLLSDGVYRQLQLSSSGPWRLCLRDGNAYRNISDSDWVQLDKQSGNQDASESSVSYVHVGCRTINPSNQSRSVKLYLLSDLHEALPANARLGYKPLEVTISQRRFTFRVNGSDQGSTLSIPAYMPIFDSVLRIESDGNWRINSYPEWLSPTNTVAYLSQGDVNQNVPLNPKVYSNLSTAREGKISITCSYPGKDDINLEVRVIQNPLVFKVSASSSAEFHPVSNYEHNGTVLHPSSWDFSLEATDGLPWRIVQDEGNGIDFLTNETFPSSLSGQGSHSGKLYPYVNAQQETRRYKFHFETNDGRFAEPVRVGSFQLTQKPYEWGSQAINEMVFDALSGIRTGNPAVSFKCSGPWYIENLPSWIPLTGLNQTADPSFTVVVDPNTSNRSSRSRTLIIRSEIGNYSKSFVVNQWEYFFDTNPTSKMEFATLSPTDQTVSFTCAGSWKVSNASNLVISQTSGSGDPTGNAIQLRFHPEDYFEESGDRDTYFEIESTSEGTTSYRKRVLYRQAAYLFVLNPSSVLNLSGPKDVSSRSVTVSISNGERWAAKIDNQDVATISPSSGEYQASSGTIQVYPKANYLQSSRSATITVTTEKGGKTRTLSVSQPEYKFSTSANSVSFDADGGDKTFTITSDGNWTLEKASTAAWLTISPTSGSSGSVTVTLTATSNKGSGAAARSVNLTLKGSDSTTLTKTISVSQSK